LIKPAQGGPMRQVSPQVFPDHLHRRRHVSLLAMLQKRENGPAITLPLPGSQIRRRQRLLPIGKLHDAGMFLGWFHGAGKPGLSKALAGAYRNPKMPDSKISTLACQTLIVFYATMHPISIRPFSKAE